MSEWVKISRAYTFEAAHNLPHLPEGHKCRRTHGHSYRVEIRIEGPLENAMVRGVEFEMIDAVMEALLNTVDHYELNDRIPDPTVENIARWFALAVSKGLGDIPVTARVQEGPRSWAQATWGKA